MFELIKIIVNVNAPVTSIVLSPVPKAHTIISVGLKQGPLT